MASWLVVLILLHTGFQLQLQFVPNTKILMGCPDGFDHRFRLYAFENEFFLCKFGLSPTSFSDWKTMQIGNSKLTE